METWPTYAKLLFNQPLTLTPDDPLQRTPMDSGDVKQLKVRSAVLTAYAINIALDSNADLQSFKTWRRVNINYGDWFNFTDPVTGNTLAFRFRRYGKETAVDRAMIRWTIDADLETYDA